MPIYQDLTQDRSNRYARHVSDICTAFGIHALRVYNAKDCGADAVHGDIRICKINGPIEYVAAMHELGHLLHPTGNFGVITINLHGLVTMEPEARVAYFRHDEREMYRMLKRYCALRLQEEASAWEWVMTHTLQPWTPLMESTKTFSEESYRHTLEPLLKQLTEAGL